MSGYIGPIPVPQGIQDKESFTATASQTTFTTRGYTDGAFINVYLNGVRLINGTDYTATNGSDIVLTTGASASDVLDFETFNSFELVSGTQTTPTFKTSATLKNDTHEDTDGGRESTLIFQGEQSGGEISTLAEIEASHDGTSDDEKGELILRVNDGNDGTSPSEVMRIDSLGNVGIGTNTIDVSTQAGGSGYKALQIESDEGGQLNFDHNDAGTGSTLGQINFQRAGEVVAEIEGVTDGATDNGKIVFRTQPDGGALTERMRIDHNGTVTLTSTEQSIATFAHSSSSTAALNGGAIFNIKNTDTTNGNQSSLIFRDSSDNASSGIFGFNVDHSDGEGFMKFCTRDSGGTFVERMRVESDGDVAIGATSASSVLHIAKSDQVVSGFSGQLLTLDGTGGSNTGDAGVLMKTPTNSGGFMKDTSDGDTFRIFGGNGFSHSSDFRISNVGNVTIGGSLSKGSGSFKIRHPLESKKDTHWLVHSFVEGPQADNLYRGKVTLVDGTATQNIDTVAGMTEGTFDALNREVQCFTTNETGWTAIKGSVSGNILTITAQDNTCTDTISWMVIGERKDEHMMSKHTPWTDSDGKVILEPELTDREKEDKTEYLEGVGE